MYTNVYFTNVITGAQTDTRTAGRQNASGLRRPRRRRHKNLTINRLIDD